MRRELRDMWMNQNGKLASASVTTEKKPVQQAKL
jgi:hypothetical protein